MTEHKTNKFNSSSEGIKYRTEWKRQNCDRYELIMPKGHKQKIADAAAAHGMSMAQYVLTAIEEYTEKHPVEENGNE